MNNAKRSNRFEVALLSLRDDYDQDIRTTLIDLLTDARHWCDRRGQSFAELDRQAYGHYLVELHEHAGRRP
jgi:hypothetical protein